MPLSYIWRSGSNTSSVKKVSAKTWRFVTRFTSQSSYFYGEHHWPNSTNVEKTDLQPPHFINLLSFLKVKNRFLLDWIWKYRCTARTGKDLYYLVFIDHLGLHVYPLLWTFVTCMKTMLMGGLKKQIALYVFSYI